MSEKTILCVECRSTYSNEDLEGAYCCPGCGTDGIPGDLSKTHTLTFTDHEWRILFMWAENYAQSISSGSPSAARVVAAIRSAAKSQAPTLPPLTLMDEVLDLANATGLTVEVHGPGHDGGTTVLPATKH